jgi:PspA-Associated protein
VIVRIMGEGQYQIDDGDVEALNALDSALTAAIDSGDETAFQTALSALLDKVRAAGTALPDDTLEPSDAVLPGADAALSDVVAMLGDEGLVPG